MSKLEAISRYNHIINKLRLKSSNFDEISSYLEQMGRLEGYNYNISKRTFARDREDIATIYNIEIEYNPVKAVYEIVYDLDRGDENQRRMEALDLFNALNMSERISKSLFLENRKAQGTENLYGLLHAVENRLKIKFNYLKYGDKTPRIREARPYALKEFRYRWYVLAENDGMVKTFALDRLSGLEITAEEFAIPHDFDAVSMFKNSYGIMLPEPRAKVEEIVLSFDPLQGEYVKSLPYHHSQEVLIDDEGELRIKLNMYVTHDFIMDILSNSCHVQVLSPPSLIDEVSTMLQAAATIYKG